LKNNKRKRERAKERREREREIERERKKRIIYIKFILLKIYYVKIHA